MSVDVSDSAGGKPRALQSQPQGSLLLRARWFRACDVVGVGSDTGARQHGQDPSSSGLGMRGALQNEEPGALAQDEAVAVRGEGA